MAVVCRIDRVLQHWGLVAAVPKYFSLDGGKACKLTLPLEKLARRPKNYLVEYPMCEGGMIADIMGPSYYLGIENGERYFQKITVITGTDFRVYNGYETSYTRIIEPPRSGGNPVRPYKPELVRSSDPDPTYWHDNEAYPADEQTEPPQATLKQDRHPWPLPKGFHGIWRSGVALDCGKDCPAFMEKTNLVPSKKFAKDLEKAFGTKLVQVGHVY